MDFRTPQKGTTPSRRASSLSSGLSSTKRKNKRVSFAGDEELCTVNEYEKEKGTVTLSGTKLGRDSYRTEPHQLSTIQENDDLRSIEGEEVFNKGKFQAHEVEQQIKRRSFGVDNVWDEGVVEADVENMSMGGTPDSEFLRNRQSMDNRFSIVPMIGVRQSFPPQDARQSFPPKDVPTTHPAEQAMAGYTEEAIEKAIQLHNMSGVIPGGAKIPRTPEEDAERLTLVTQIQGLVSADVVLESLGQSVDNFEPRLVAERAEQQEREFSRKLRDEQDEAYQESLRMDREKEEKANQIRQQQQQQLKKQQQEEETKRKETGDKSDTQHLKQDLITQNENQFQSSNKILPVVLSENMKQQNQFQLANQYDNNNVVIESGFQNITLAKQQPQQQQQQDGNAPMDFEEAPIFQSGKRIKYSTEKLSEENQQHHQQPNHKDQNNNNINDNLNDFIVQSVSQSNNEWLQAQKQELQELSTSLNQQQQQQQQSNFIQITNINQQNQYQQQQQPEVCDMEIDVDQLQMNNYQNQNLRPQFNKFYKKFDKKQNEMEICDETPEKKIIGNLNNKKEQDLVVQNEFQQESNQISPMFVRSPFPGGVKLGRSPVENSVGLYSKPRKLSEEQQQEYRSGMQEEVESIIRSENRGVQTTPKKPMLSPAQNITLQQFLNKLQISQLSTLQRCGSALRPDMVDFDKRPDSFSEHLQMTYLVSIEREVLQGCTNIIDKTITEKKLELADKERHLAVNNPAIFQQVRCSSDSQNAELSEQLSQLLESFKLQDQASWTNWTADTQEHLYNRYQHSHQLLQSKQQNLQRQYEELQKCQSMVQDYAQKVQSRKAEFNKRYQVKKLIEQRQQLQTKRDQLLSRQKLNKQKLQDQKVSLDDSRQQMGILQQEHESARQELDIKTSKQKNPEAFTPLLQEASRKVTILQQLGVGVGKIRKSENGSFVWCGVLAGCFRVRLEIQNKSLFCASLQLMQQSQIGWRISSECYKLLVQLYGNGDQLKLNTDDFGRIQLQMRKWTTLANSAKELVQELQTTRLRTKRMNRGPVLKEGSGGNSVDVEFQFMNAGSKCWLKAVAHLDKDWPFQYIHVDLETLIDENKKLEETNINNSEVKHTNLRSIIQNINKIIDQL